MKPKKIKFEIGKSGVCITDCKHISGIKIGSIVCTCCRFCKGHDILNNFVLCAHDNRDIYATLKNYMLIKYCVWLTNAGCEELMSEVEKVRIKKAERISTQ